MKRLLYAALLVGVAACGGKEGAMPENMLVRNDFESLAGWQGGAPSPSLTKEKAHSGSYSIKVGPAIEYGVGYLMPLGKVSPTRVKKIKVKGWAYSPSKEATGIIVVELKDPATGKSLMWEGMDLTKQVKKYNEWVEVEQDVTLPETATSTTNLNVYFWRGSGQRDMYFDDLEITNEQ